MLMVTTSVRMLDWVHGDTSNDRPHLSLRLLSVVLSAGLEDWLFVSASTGDDADHGSGFTADGLLDTGWQFESGLGAVLAVADDRGEGARGPGELALVSCVQLNVADRGTFRDLVDRQHVADAHLS